MTVGEMQDMVRGWFKPECQAWAELLDHVFVSNPVGWTYWIALKLDAHDDCVLPLGHDEAHDPGDPAHAFDVPSYFPPDVVTAAPRNVRLGADDRLERYPDDFDVGAAAVAHSDEMSGRNLPLAVRAARARSLSVGAPVVKVQRCEPDS